MATYLFWLQVTPLPGCKMVREEFDPSLECAVAASSLAEARSLLDAELHRGRYELAQLDGCVAYSEAQWEGASDSNRRVRDAAAKAQRAGGVVFGSFGRAPEL